MFITDYRALQRTDLRDTGASAYFSDAELDGFHLRALQQYAKYLPATKQLTLSIPAGQALTPLPQDFLAPEPNTFLTAVGVVPQASGNYSDLYAQSEAFQPATAGLEAGFAGSSYSDWLMGPLTSVVSTTVATILPGNPPSLLLSPVPKLAISASVLYFADYVLPGPSPGGPAANLPDRESGLVLDYACHLACEALLGDLTLTQSIKVGDRQITRASAVPAIAAKSERKRLAFDQLTRNRAIGSMG
jgi:hypothetical protein